METWFILFPSVLRAKRDSQMGHSVRILYQHVEFPPGAFEQQHVGRVQCFSASFCLEVSSHSPATFWLSLSHQLVLVWYFLPPKKHGSIVDMSVKSHGSPWKELKHTPNGLCLYDVVHKVLPHIALLDNCAFYNKTYLWCTVKPDEVVW